MYEDSSPCPACSTGTLKCVQKDLEFKYKGAKITFRNKTVHRCTSCSEEFLNRPDSQEIERLLIEDRRRIDSDRLVEKS